MRHFISRPYGNSFGVSRILSLIVLLALLAFLYERARQPQTWKWLTDEKATEETAPSPSHNPETPPVPNHDPGEVLISGTNDKDEAQRDELTLRMRAVADRSALQPREMPAYWLLMAWSRCEPLAELRTRAAAEPAFSELHERPNDFRGRPMRLSLHVRRVLKYEAPENSQGIQELYELWGWTDTSKSFPYVVVLPELPPGVPIGADVHAEVTFAGYFLKLMAYTAYDVRRVAPLMIGRAEQAGRPIVQQQDDSSVGITIIGGIASIVAATTAISTWWKWRGKIRKKQQDNKKVIEDLPLWPSLSSSDSPEEAPALDAANDKCLP